jgi:opacity protein-like surface antigen
VAFRGSNSNITAFVNGPGGATVATFSCGSGFGCGNTNTVGWVAGVGGEYAITNNVSLGVEWLHAGFGHGDRIDPILTAYFGTPTTSNRGNRDIDIVRARLDFKFNGLFGPY